MIAIEAIVVIVVFYFSASHSTPVKREDETLRLVHVIFRHGNRTAYGENELYPNDPYYNKTYYPIGQGQLTNAGKQKQYEIGTKLRSRYDSFLGDALYPGLVDSRSTAYNTTKASLLYTLAGLFPPKGDQVWNENLEWQAATYNYWDLDEDKVLMSWFCPNYDKLYQEEKYSDENLAEYAKYSEIMNYISENSGLNITTFEDVYNLNFGISTEFEYGLPLPSWLDEIWPDDMKNLSVKAYHVASGKPVMKRLLSGYLMRKIIEDSINKLSEDVNNEFKRKLYLYAAHEFNIAYLLITLGVFDDVMPNYGSFVVFELHVIDDVPGFKIMYENNINGLVQLSIPGCENVCSLEQFTNLFQDYLPLDGECGL